MTDQALELSKSQILYRGRLAILALAFLVLGAVGSTLSNHLTSFELTGNPIPYLVSYAMCSISTDAAFLWAAMQGPGRWRQTLWGIAYLLPSALVSYFAFAIPYGFRFDVFLAVDLPAGFLDLTNRLALLKIASLLTGIEIVAREDQTAGRQDIATRSAWTISRWMWLLISIAIFAQTSIAQARLYTPLVTTNPTNITTTSSSVAFFSNIFWPAADDAQEGRFFAWTGMFFFSKLSESILSLLAAGWVFSGRRWRWWLIPVLGLLVYAAKLLCAAMINSFSKTVNVALLLPLTMDFGLINMSGSEIALHLAYACLTFLGQIGLACLVFWVGCKWRQQVASDGNISTQPQMINRMGHQ